MKTLFVSLAGIFAFTYTSAQVCVKPEPLTPAQVLLVAGTWKMSYSMADKTYDAEVRITATGENTVTCEITRPPLPGKETGADYFFCPGGEFHLKKNFGNISYMFQAVPENGRMKGILSFYDAKNKRTQGGSFVMEKAN